MRFTSAFVVASMALGAMAGCNRDAGVCRSSVIQINKGLTDGWVCDRAEDFPCQTDCDTIGGRATSTTTKILKCCRPVC
ncbi:hypothetical protein CTA1_6055 [Colletotrichum tanaceti]|uniref:Uncharacterized protein n=1 Tax=Colletotrichum tanaceti TaxID=1306861 RepID=A0A4U6X368_9PEZI|nr:hypothetical protein CTA1_6055 [Colletotrichum tanaceti]